MSEPQRQFRFGLGHLLGAVCAMAVLLSVYRVYPELSFALAILLGLVALMCDWFGDSLFGQLVLAGALLLTAALAVLSKQWVPAFILISFSMAVVEAWIRRR